MTPLEWLAAAAVVAAALASWRTPRPWLVLGTVAVAFAVGLLGTPRWQLVPAGLALALLAGIALLQATSPDAPRTLPRLASTIAILGVAVSALLAWVLPVPRLALEPDSGSVGSVAFDLTDPSRSNPSGRDEGPRVTPVQAWYPTADDEGQQVRLSDEPAEFAAAAASFLELPAFALTHLGAIETAALDGAEPVEERLPVVLSIHGWGGFRFAQAPLLEQLAADGHLVLAMDHTYGALAAQPVAGGVVPLDEQLLPEGAPPAVYDAAAQRLEQAFADDAAFLLEALRAGDTQVPAAILERADLDRLVVLGHSTGGGAAALLCAAAPCDAMVQYDPWVEPVPAAVRADGFAAPTLVLLSGAWDGNDNDQVLRPMVAASDDTLLYVFDGTEHRDVTVQPLLTPLAPRLGLAGEVPQERVDEVVTAMTRSWLARTIGSGIGDADLADDPGFPELRPGQ